MLGNLSIRRHDLREPENEYTGSLRPYESITDSSPLAVHESEKRLDGWIYSICGVKIVGKTRFPQYLWDPIYVCYSSNFEFPL